MLKKLNTTDLTIIRFIYNKILVCGKDRNLITGYVGLGAVPGNSFCDKWPSKRTSLSTVWNTLYSVKCCSVLTRPAPPTRSGSLRCGLTHVAGLQLIMTICVSTDWIIGELRDNCILWSFLMRPLPQHGLLPHLQWESWISAFSFSTSFSHSMH